MLTQQVSIAGRSPHACTLARALIRNPNSLKISHLARNIVIPESSMWHQVLQSLVSSKPSANGLAIIIANQNSCRPDHVPLTGPVQDLHAAKDAFEALKFATLPIQNASAQDIIEVKNKPLSICFVSPAIDYTFGGECIINIIGSIIYGIVYAPAYRSYLILCPICIP